MYVCTSYTYTPQIDSIRLSRARVQTNPQPQRRKNTPRVTSKSLYVSLKTCRYSINREQATATNLTRTHTPSLCSDEKAILAEVLDY